MSDEMTIWHCIPKRLEDAVDFVDLRSNGEDDPYWIFLKEGWVSYDGGSDCGTIHERTVKDLKAAIKTIRRGERLCQ